MWFDETQELLGSVLRITFEHSDPLVARPLMDACWEKIAAFQKRYSRFLSGNILEDVNMKVGEWQNIDDETFAYLKHVRDLRERFPLNFSLAVKGILERMGYDSDYSFIKNNAIISDSDARDFLLRDSGEVFIFNPLEFGGFGKGNALDMVAEVLRDVCQNICLDFGGDLYARGVNAKGERWKMAIESPFHEDEAMGTIELDGSFLAVSNTLKRRWGAEGEYHHLIDPTKGVSANYWVGACVLASSGMEADFLATALFCTDADAIDSASKFLSGSRFLLVDPNGNMHQHDFPAVLFS